MAKKPFLERLEDGAILFDGGMGTELYSRGIFINKCYEELNLSNPDLIMQIHKAYIEAGADVLETNSFGSNRFKLKTHLLDDKIYQINYQAGLIAKKVAGEDIYVAGAIGPLGVQIEPLGAISCSEAHNYFKEQIVPLVESGVDLLIFETFVYPGELHQAILAAREVCNLPIIAQMTIDEDCRSITGASPQVLLPELVEFGADIVGINCTVGPQVMLNWLEEARKYSNMPLSIMPNAGKPKNIDGRNIYLTSPEYIGEFAKHFIQAGANIIGGCCGTAPDHIKKMRNMINSVKPDLKRKKLIIKELQNENPIVPLIEQKKKSRLARRMTEGKFVTFVELLAPYGVSSNSEIEKAREMFYYGIDVINIPDGPRASSRMSALSLAVQIQQQVGIETVLHYVCRDRNVIGIQSDLLGAYSLGIKNILAITGDPPKLGSYPDATAVFDVDSIGLVNILSRLNCGMDIAGNQIGSPSGFFIGVGANPDAVNLDEELKRLYWKIDAGAEFIVTQPVFSVQQYIDFYEKTKHFNLPIIAGIWPLTSIRNAEFMNNEIHGCYVPEEILKRLRKVSHSKEAGIEVGIAIAKEILGNIIDISAGVQISAPFGRVQSVIDILAELDN